MSEVEETLKRIQAHKGVVGVIVVNNEGKERWGLMLMNGVGRW